jgi:hypothetical protein
MECARLSGCLKSAAVPAKEKGSPEGFAEAAMTRHDRISKQKP